MDVTLIYFSQTGNTRRVAETMAGAFREAGHSTRTISFKKVVPEDATKGDLLGVMDADLQHDVCAGRVANIHGRRSCLSPKDRQIG